MSFLSKLKYLHKKTAPFISGPALLPFTSNMTTQSSKNKKVIRLAYSVSENSKLFKYMSHCDGWPQVKNDLLRVSKNPQQSSMIMTTSCSVAISAGIIYTIIAAISVLFVISLCKGYNIKFKVKPKDFEFEFDIKKP